MSATAAASDWGQTVALRDVERELSAQMQAMQGADAAPVQRVRMSNLVVYCDRPQTADAIALQMPDILNVHPARVLMLLGERTAEKTEITASVLARARPLSQTQLAFSEQVLLHATGGAVERLPFAVRALLIGDLPTNLWWAAPTPPAFGGVLLHDLAEAAQQIIYDSTSWPDPIQGVATTAGWLESIERGTADGRWRVASDLNWRRLKYWRRLVAQALDPASAPGAAESVTELTVEHGPHSLFQGWGFAAWLSRRLGWTLRIGKVQPGVEISWHFRSAQGEPVVRIKRFADGAPGIHRVRLACSLTGKPVVMNLAMDGPYRLAITPEGLDAAPRTMTVPPLTPAELIGRQLSDREPDPAFRESMAVAQAMARSVAR